MRLFLLSALCSLLSALSVTAQTKQVIKGISDNALTESLVVPTGKTLTINSGGSIVNNGTATGFTTGLAIGTSSITGGTSGHVLYNNAGTLGGLALNASAVGLGNVSNALQLVAANNLSDLTNAVTARTNLGLGTLATQSATITDYLTTATAATTYQPLATLLTSFSNLASSAGVLTNNGSGTLSYTATSTGGNGVTDGLKLATFNLNGYLLGRRMYAQDPAASSSITTNLIYNGVQFNTSLVATTTLSATSGASTFLLPGISSGTYNLISTGDTGTVTNTMLAGSIDLTTKVTGTLPVANGGTGITALGTGVATALGNTVNAASGLLTYSIIGTSGAAVPLLNGTNTISGVTTFTAAPIISTGSDVATNLIIRNAAGTQPRVQMGTLATSTTYGAIYLGNVTPGGTNYALISDGASTYINAPTTVRFSVAGTEFFNLSSSGLTFGTSTLVNWNSDLYLMRDAAATLQMGQDSATPITQRITAPDGSGTNIAGASIGLQSGVSTGTGAGGDVFVETSMSGSSGTSANTVQERSRIIGRFVNLTETTATNFASIALASGKVVGGTATITVWASDGTDFQTLTSEIRFSAVNKAGTITATVSQTDGTTAASAGTLTVTYDATQSGSAVLLRANATSSLTQTILRSRCVITALNGDDTQTVTPQ